MEMILEGIGYKTLINIFDIYNKNIKGLYLDKKSDLYDLYLKDVEGVKIYDDYTIIVFKEFLSNKKLGYKLLGNNEYTRIVIQ